MKNKTKEETMEREEIMDGELNNLTYDELEELKNGKSS